MADVVVGRITRRLENYCFVRLQDGRTVFAHRKQMSGRWTGQLPEEGRLVNGQVVESERGPRLIGWWPYTPPPTELEEKLRSEVLRISLLLRGLDWERYGSPWHSYRCLGGESPVQPHCPECGAQLAPSITEGREDTKDGYRTIWTWEFRCQCGFAEQAKTAWVVDRYTVPESEDGYRAPYTTEEEYEALVSQSGVVWIDHAEEERRELLRRRDELQARIDEMRRQRM